MVPLRSLEAAETDPPEALAEQLLAGTRSTG
jgi:hypothetical protein